MYYGLGIFSLPVRVFKFRVTRSSHNQLQSKPHIQLNYVGQTKQYTPSKTERRNPNFKTELCFCRSYYQQQPDVICHYVQHYVQHFAHFGHFDHLVILVIWSFWSFWSFFSFFSIFIFNFFNFFQFLTFFHFRQKAIKTFTLQCIILIAPFSQTAEFLDR